MRKKLILIIFIILFHQILKTDNIKNFSNSFFGVYGRQSSVMGKTDGSALEIWIYPYKVLHDLSFKVLVEGSEQSPYNRMTRFDISHRFFKREFVGENWRISQMFFPALNDPVVFLVYNITALENITLEFSFKPDLSPMWPASIGGKYSYWSKEGFFVLSESSSKNTAILGGFPGEKIGKLPAHKLPSGKLRYRIQLEKGNHEIPLTIVAGRGRIQEIKKIFLANKSKHKHFLNQRSEKIEKFINSHLSVETSCKKTNEALKWGMLNLNFAFVNNPQLGEGLIAGYGLSGEGERPGFCWFFGGDGLINSYALINCGDFSGARKELEFLLKYQRDDGKIMHELSQGADFINWFRDYGFPYFHGDTTLYFASFLNFYLKRTGDTDFLIKNKSGIDKVFSWLKKCDSDKDGIVETKLAGVGASETGPLRQKMKTDIYLAALSVKSWESMRDIYTILRDKQKTTLAKNRLKKSKNSMDRLFWDKKNKYYAYAVKENNKQVQEITIWPAVAMRFSVLTPEKGKLAKNRIASPELSTDWGTRFLSSGSEFYDPSSYNNGAVWPFLTGFSSLALYNYKNPFHALSLLMANLNIIMDYDPGAPTELLSGEIYRPLDQSVPNQIWSSGNTISAFVEGLLGFDADALKKEINLKPKIPFFWEHLKVDRLKTGKGEISFKFNRKANHLNFRFNFKNLKGYTFHFHPEILALNLSYSVNNKKVSALNPRLISETDESMLLRIDMDGYFYPYVPKHLHEGQFSKEIIIQDVKLDRGSVNMIVWGKSISSIHFYSDLDVLPGLGKLKKEKDNYILKIPFADQWEKKSITFMIKMK